MVDPGTNSGLPTHTYDTKYSTFHSDDFTENSFWNLFITITYCRHCYFWRFQISELFSGADFKQSGETLNLLQTRLYQEQNQNFHSQDILQDKASTQTRLT